MAEVFKAKSYGVEGFEKVVVIKRILPELAKSKEFVDMFIHEAKLAVRLSHANIVQVFDLGIAPADSSSPTSVEAAAKSDNASGAYYMAMEFVHGSDLATLLARCRRQQVTLPIDMSVYIASEVAKGLDHAHRRRDEQLRPLGIVHCDVSPQNVLLSLEGEVKVTDFGIAKARGVFEPKGLDDTRSRQLQGKFGYMSPEHARGDAVDARSDLFSLAVLLYECIAGVNPFSAPTTFETLRRVQACEYPPIELLRPEIPAELVAIMKTALAKAPQDRYPDAGRMYEALLTFLYAQGQRYSAHDLAEFLARFRTREETLSNTPMVAAVLEGDGANAGANAAELTPVEAAIARHSSILPPKHESGSHVLDLDRAADLGERREVTVLVIELPHREGEGAADGGDVASDKAEAILARYGGLIVKREPAQITALFGLGDPDGRDTEVATRCALVALRSMEGPRLASAGLHTGRIHVSSTGTPTEDERLEALIAAGRELARVREGRCAISASAMRQVNALFDFESLAEAVEPPSSSSLEDIAAAKDERRAVIVPHGGQLVREVKSPAEAFGRFVGRKDELRRVGEILAASTKRTARALTIRGDHGVGKTRLLVEVERRLKKGGYNIGWHLTTCPPRGSELPLSGIVCMLQALCGVVEGDSHERVMTVQPRLRALALHDEEVNAVLSALGANVPTSSAASAKGSLRAAFTRMVASLCDDRPHTFAWDAAHSMDAESFLLLEAAFARLAHVRVVFVFAARAGFTHPLEKLGTHASLDLADLKSEDVERLIALRLGVEKAPPRLVEFVRERAGGHPQFIEEILKGLVDARAVTVADKQIVTMKLVGQDLALPKTLRGLVASRITRLSPEDRAALQAAAVLGDPMNVAVLSQMLGRAMGALERSLATLKEREFVVHTTASELRFTSPTVREVVVDALTHEASRAMHAAAGSALEKFLGAKAWEQASRIATHFYEAGEREHAATYFAKSAERRLESRQLEAAARDFARAIELCDLDARSPEELAKWLAGLAQAVRLVRSLPEAADMCDRIVARIDASADLATRVRARVDAGRILGALHLFEAARRTFADAERIADDTALVRPALVASAELALRQGDFTQSLEHLERLEKSASALGDKQEEHKLLMSLSQTHAARGDRLAATTALDRAERLLGAEKTAACERQKLRGLVEYFARDYRAAAIMCEKAVDMARDAGLTYEVAVNLHNLGDALIRQEDYPRAYGAIQQSLALCDESGFERLASHNRMFLAFLNAVAGDDEQEALLVAGLRYAESNEFTWDIIGGRWLLAQLRLKRGDVSSARTELERLREVALAAGNRLVLEDCEAALQKLAG